MDELNWLPKNCLISDQCKVKKLLSFDAQWQLYSTNKDGLALVIRPGLCNKWISIGLITKEITSNIQIESKRYKVIVVPYGTIIASVKYGPYPETNSEAEAFAIALRDTRSKLPDVSFEDALYLERECVILPSFNDGNIDDAKVLGRWLSQGVNISVNQFERICELLTWMHPTEIARISEVAGFVIEKERQTAAIEEKKSVPAPRHNPSGRHINQNERFKLIGRPELENFFNDHIIDIVLHSAEYKRMGIDSPSGIILYGPPGCGKTYAVERLIDYLGWPDFSIDSSTIGSKFIHETSKKISEVFDAAIEKAPSIIVIDEMEAFLTDRERTVSETGHVEEVAEFLRRIPEALSKGVLIIAMTNMIDSIDPAIRRRGRFDHLIEVKMPSKEEVKTLLEYLLKEIPKEDSIDMDGLASALEGHPMSDVTFVVKEAGRLSVRKKKEKIDNDILLIALNSLPKMEKSKRKIGFTLDD